MSQQNSYSPAAASYAQALIELAPDSSSAESLGDDLASLAGSLKAEATLRAFFADPSITPADRWQVIEGTFRGKASALFLNFLGVLNEKGRLALIGEISSAYQDMLDRRQNRVRVEVVVAEKLSDSDLASVQQRVSAALGKTAIIEQKIDERIIGGLVLRMHDTVIDGSVKTQLEAMRRQMLAARVPSPARA